MNAQTFIQSLLGRNINQSLDHNVYREFTIYIMAIPQLPFLYEFYDWLLLSNISDESMHLGMALKYLNLHFGFLQQILLF